MRAIAAILCLTAPTLAFAQQGQPPATQGNTAPQGVQQGQPPQVAQECLNRLRQVNEELVGAGYGMAGPTGVWSPHMAYGTATAPTTAPPAAGAGQGTLNPRTEMRSLMNAGHILAMNGYGEACDSVVSAVQDIQNRYQTARATGDTDQMLTWRERYLASSVPVGEAAGPVAVDQIIGADIRNMRDEDLGDIEDIVLDRNGSIQYVLVGRGGFLGLGQTMVPVRWADLRMTTDPSQDTFVLNVSEDAFDNAPSVNGDASRQLARDELAQEIDRFWDQRLAQGDAPSQPAAGGTGTGTTGTDTGTGTGGGTNQ